MSAAKIICLSLLVLGLVLACGQKEESIQWCDSVEGALSQARQSGQHVLMEFYTQNCKWCAALAETTFADPAVVAFSRDFLWARVDANEDTLARNRHQIFAYPTTVLLDPSGEEVDRIVGYLRPEPFMEKVRDYLSGRGTLADLLERVGVAPQDVHLKFQLGEKYQEHGLWEESLAVFDEVIRLVPDQAESLAVDALYYQGEALRRLNRTDQAVGRFRQLMRQYPNSEQACEAQLEIGYTYQRADRHQEAVAAYQQFLQHHPDHQYVEWVNQQLEKLAGTSAE